MESLNKWSKKWGPLISLILSVASLLTAIAGIIYTHDAVNQVQNNVTSTEVKLGNIEKSIQNMGGTMLIGNTFDHNGIGVQINGASGQAR